MLIILFFLLTSVLEAQNLPKVFVVESYAGDYAWDAGWKSGLDAVLKDQARLEFFELNTKRLPEELHAGMADKAWAAYKVAKPDLVVLADDAAVKFLGERFGSQPLPVVYFGVNNNPRYYYRSLPSNTTGIIERPLLKRNLVYAQEIIPSARQALILFDTDITAKVTKSELFGGLDHLDMGSLRADIRLLSSWEDWQQEVLNAGSRYQFIILGLYHTIRNRTGTYVEPEEVARWTSLNSPVPVLGFWDFSVGPQGTLGGLILSAQDLGERAGRLVLEILRGRRPRDIPPAINNQGRFLFSRSQLERWKLTLPETILRQAQFLP